MTAKDLLKLVDASLKAGARGARGARLKKAQRELKAGITSRSRAMPGLALTREDRRPRSRQNAPAQEDALAVRGA